MRTRGHLLKRTVRELEEVRNRWAGPEKAFHEFAREVLRELRDRRGREEIEALGEARCGRFHRGDAPDANGALDYEKLKPWVLATGVDLINAGVKKPVRPEGNPGAEVSFVRADFDDAAWKSVRLPHDWAVEGPFDLELPGDTGKLPWQGVGWYRKTFTVPATDAGRRVFLDIDGAMAYSTVWLNGHLVGGWPYGYTSYRLDLTPYLKIGDSNTLAIRLDNPPESSRWYPGSGLYRNVWLVKTDPVHVVKDGVYITTPRVTAEAAEVTVQVELRNLSENKLRVGVGSRIHELDAQGRPAALVAESEVMEVEIDPKRARDALRSNRLVIANPQLWRLDDPRRYIAVTELRVDGHVVDRVETPFGVRTIAWDPDRGFLLNGEHVYLKGVCMHHDLGALGAAVNVRATERQLEILREIGVNAIRCSHNPSSPELLELCDRMGFLVMAESFDAWRRGKKWPAHIPEYDPNNYYYDYGRIFDDWHERDLRALIRRDRNHPSVVIWSIGNEIIEQWFTDGWKVAVRLSGIVREEDRTRPITGGFNNPEAGYIGMQAAVDAIGFNYKPWEYVPFKRRNPTIPVYGAETASTVSSRGEYVFPVVTDDKLQGRENFHVSSYDLFAPPWASSPDFEFKHQDESAFVGGEFVWTGFDYLGEPTPYNSDATNLLNFSDPEQRARMAAELEKLGKIRVPSRSSYFGIVDLAGFPKDRFYLYQARWRPELPMAHILPHWNWPERVGQVTPVHVYSSGDEAELFLNGKSLGRKKRGSLEYRFRWDDVVYQPGELKVVTYKNGKPWADAVTRTTGIAEKLMLTADRAKIRADGDDLSFVTVKIVDKDGLVVPRSKNALAFEVSGPGEIVATDNGDPTDLTAFPSHERKAFNGLALVIVRAKPGEPGAITLKARGEGLRGAEITLTSE